MHLPERPLRCAPAAIAGNVLTLAALLLLPLYMPSGYVGLVDAKFHLLLWLAGGGPLRCWSGRLWLGLRGRAPAVRLDLATALPLPVLCLSYTVAWFFAEDRALALWGLAGRYNGLLMLLACTVLYFVVRLVGGGVPSVWFGRLLAGAGCAVTLLSWLNFFMADPLDAYYSFLPGRGGLFLGTVGNINFYGALLDICLPIAVWELLTAPDRDTARRWGAVSVCLGTGLIAAGSDARLARGRLRGVGALHGTACHGGAAGPAALRGRGLGALRRCGGSAGPLAAHPHRMAHPVRACHTAVPRAGGGRGVFCAGRTAAPLAHGPQLASRAGAGCPDRFTGG